MTSILGFAFFLALCSAFYYSRRANQLAKQLFQLENNNPITGLPNQTYLINHLGEPNHHQTDADKALIYFKLENFRDINQVFGLDFGNQLIADFTLRVRLFLPPNALLCHIGIDRFCLLFKEPMTTEHAEKLCAKIRESMHVPFKVHGYTVRLKPVFGFGQFHTGSVSFKKSLLQLEQMVREQAANNDQKLLVFTEQSSMEQSLRIRLKNDLKAAVESGQFIPYFQPIINLSTGQVEKAEMLIRWRHPELGFIKPSDFIPMAEQTGSILQIGKWCRSQAIEHCKYWDEALNRPIQLSINMSPIELMDDGPDSSIQAFISSATALELPMNRFVFEITEGALVLEDPISESKVNQIVSGGIDLSIDDFGTGFSSIAYLNRFPIRFLKLDISFVRYLADDTSKQVICDHIIRMAHALEIQVVAEGIETPEQADILRAMNCDYGQGYLYSPPIAAAAFEEGFL